MLDSISMEQLQRCADLLAMTGKRRGNIELWRAYGCDYPTHPGERLGKQSIAPDHTFRLRPESIELQFVDCQFPEGLPPIPPQIKHLKLNRCQLPQLRALSTWRGLSLALNDCQGASLEGADEVEFVSLHGQSLWPGLGKNVKGLQLGWWTGELSNLPTGLDSLFIGQHQSVASWGELHMPERAISLLSISHARFTSLAALKPPSGLRVLLIEYCSMINHSPDWRLFSGLLALSLLHSYTNIYSARNYKPLTSLPELMASLPNLRACELYNSYIEKGDVPAKKRQQFNWSAKYDLRLALLKCLVPPAQKKTSIPQLRKLLTSDDEQKLSEGLEILRQGEAQWGEAILKGVRVERNKLEASSFKEPAKKGNLLRVIAAAPESPWVQELRASVQHLSLKATRVALESLACLPNLDNLELHDCQTIPNETPLGLNKLAVWGESALASLKAVSAPGLLTLRIFQHTELLVSGLDAFPLLAECDIAGSIMCQLRFSAPHEGLTRLSIDLYGPRGLLSLGWVSSLPRLRRLEISFYGNSERASLTEVEALQNHPSLKEVRLFEVGGQEELQRRFPIIHTQRAEA